MSSTAVETTAEGPKYEYFFRDGHFNNTREILTGPNAYQTFNEIPQIDIGGIFSDKLEDRMAVAKEIANACENVGFFYIKNHGIDQDFIDDMFETSRKFFEQPIEKKMELWCFKNPTFRGYDTFYQENRGKTKKGGKSSRF